MTQFPLSLNVSPIPVLQLAKLVGWKRIFTPIGGLHKRLVKTTADPVLRAKAEWSMSTGAVPIIRALLVGAASTTAIGFLFYNSPLLQGNYVPYAEEVISLTAGVYASQFIMVSMRCKNKFILFSSVLRNTGLRALDELVREGRFDFSTPLLMAGLSHAEQERLSFIHKILSEDRCSSEVRSVVEYEALALTARIDGGISATQEDETVHQTTTIMSALGYAGISLQRRPSREREPS